MSNEIDAKPGKTTPAAVSARWLLKALCGTLNAVILLLTLLCYLVRMDPSDQDTIVFAHFTGWAAAGLGMSRCSSCWSPVGSAAAGWCFRPFSSPSPQRG